MAAAALSTSRLALMPLRWKRPASGFGVYDFFIYFH
jgi:hypothetical protein